jgi:hypothetical protein
LGAVAVAALPGALHLGRGSLEGVGQVFGLTAPDVHLRERGVAVAPLAVLLGALGDRDPHVRHGDAGVGEAQLGVVDQVADDGGVVVRWVRAATRSSRRLVNKCSTTAWSSTLTRRTAGTLRAATATGAAAGSRPGWRGCAVGRAAGRAGRSGRSSPPAPLSPVMIAADRGERQDRHGPAWTVSRGSGMGASVCCAPASVRPLFRPCAGG